MIKLPLLQLFLSKHKTCCACGPAAFAASSLATYLFQKAPECLMAGFCQGTCGGQDCFKQLLATACHWSETARSSWTAKKEGNMMLRAFRCKSVSACASHTALSSSVGGMSCAKSQGKALGSSEAQGKLWVSMTAMADETWRRGEALWHEHRSAWR
eukprot:s11021_g1.t1